MVTCALTGAPEFAVAPASITVPAAGSATTTVTFDAATPDDYIGTLTCSSGAQTFTFPLEATAAAPGEVPLTSTPASGSTITLPQQTVGGAGTTATVSFGNENVYGLSMECSIFGDDTFSVAPESFTVPAAGSASVTVTLDSAAAGSFDGTLFCNAGKQSFSFPLFGTAAGTVTPQPPTAAAVIPAMGDAVRAAMLLLMLGLGLLALHRTRR